MRCGGPGEDKYGQATPRGAKIIQQPSSSTTRFVWRGASDWQCLEELDGSDDLVARYTYAPGYIDSPAVQERDLNGDDDFGDSNEVVYYHSNTLHSIYALSNSSEAIVERYQYDAYGAATVLDADFSDDADNASDVENPYLFTARRLDSESALMQYRNRYYDGTLGRFISRDPIGEAHIYCYCASKPTGLTDPAGLWVVDRKGAARARATAVEGDTIDSLATQVKLNTSDWKRWVKFVRSPILTVEGRKAKDELDSDCEICPGEVVTVPNTGYIDVLTYSYGVLGWHLIYYKKGVQKRWDQEGLRVLIRYPVTASAVMHNLADDDIYKYLYIGHGSGGYLTGLKETKGTPKTESIAPGKLTRYRIAEMHLIACQTNTGVDEWYKNVSAAGSLRTVSGNLTQLTFNVIEGHGMR